jgi:TonB family protein
MTARRQVALGLVSVCCCLIAGKVGSQSPSSGSSASDTAASHVRAAERFLVVTDAEKMMNEQMDQVLQVQLRRGPAMAQLLAPQQAIMRKYMTYDAIKPDLIKAYTATYSESELNQIVAFYQTDLGRMMLERTPKIIELTRAATEARIKVAEPELREAIRRSITSQFSGPESDSAQRSNNTYFAFQVEKPAAPLDTSTTLAYPASLKGTDIGGQVSVQFIVDTTGAIELGTTKVLRATNDIFAQAAREHLSEMRFSPAEKNGQKVKQLVQMTFRFEPSQ